MGRRRMTRGETWENARRERERWAPLLSEKYPSLLELRANLRYTPHDGPPEGPFERAAEWKPDSRAFFEIRCPHWECVCGGFDLSTAVADVMAKGQADGKGHLVCQGWQDEVRFRKYGCMLRLDFDLTAVFR